MISKRIFDAPTAWNQLNGVINVYKPAGLKVIQVRNTILANLCKDLNELEVPEPRQRLCIEPGGAQNYVVRKVMDLSDHVLTVGPRYQMCDLKCASAAQMGVHTSGVLILGINRGIKQTTKLHENRPVRVYHVTGRFGQATESHFRDSRITVKAKFDHVTHNRLSSLVASLQASHQRKMYELCGVDLQSQSAYEIAAKGIIRPMNNQQPVIYGIKVINFKRPEFTLEIHAINEDEDYLGTIIHEIAIELRSVAFCSSIRCIRHGHFSVENTLLRRHWTLQGILKNMGICRKIISEHPSLLKRTNIELSPD